MGFGWSGKIERKLNAIYNLKTYIIFKKTTRWEHNI